MTVVTVALTTVVAAAVVLSAGVTGSVTTASIIHVPSGPYGSYMMAQDTTLPTNDSFLALPTKNTCTCRSACRARPECVAAAVVAMEGGGWECRLSTKGPHESSHSGRQGDTYIFWEASLLPAHYFWTLEDDLAYLMVEKKMTYEDCHRFCASIPGHHLAIIRSVQTYKAMMYMSRVTGSYLRVDLTYTAGWKKTLRWRDGSKFENVWNGEKTMMTNARYLGYSLYHDGRLHYSPLSHLIYPLCQANPLQVKW